MDDLASRVAACSVEAPREYRLWPHGDGTRTRTGVEGVGELFTAYEYAAHPEDDIWVTGDILAHWLKVLIDRSENNKMRGYEAPAAMNRQTALRRRLIATMPDALRALEAAGYVESRAVRGASDTARSEPSRA